jgi:hypothetical protein
MLDGGVAVEYPYQQRSLTMRTLPVLVLAVTLTACVSDKEMSDLADAKVAAETRAAIAHSEADAATDAKVKAEAEAAEAKAKAEAQAADAAMSGKETTDTAEGIAAVITPFAGPYGPIVGIVTGLILGLARANQQKRKLVAVAKAIEKQKAKTGGTVNFKDDTVRAELTADMGAGAAAIVNEAQGKGTTSPV